MIINNKVRVRAQTLTHWVTHSKPYSVIFDDSNEIDYERILDNFRIMSNAHWCISIIIYWTLSKIHLMQFLSNWLLLCSVLPSSVNPNMILEKCYACVLIAFKHQPCHVPPATNILYSNVICISCVQFSPHMVWPANVCEMWIVFGELILCICFVRFSESSISKLYTVDVAHSPYHQHSHSHIFHFQSLEFTLSVVVVVVFLSFFQLILFSSFSMSFFDILIHKQNSISLSRFSVYR